MDLGRATDPVGNVVTFSLFVQPHAHDAIGGGVIKDLFGAAPTGLGLVALAVAANEQADEEADNDDRDDDENDEAHGRYGFLNVTAVPYATISVSDCPTSDESKRNERMASAPMS